jgi:hypothetical protein
LHRFMTFVNGSHLFGAFKSLDVFVDDYEALYRYVFEQAVARWRGSCVSPTPSAARLTRVYWYVIDIMDEWDLHSPRTRLYLQERFNDDRELKGRWMQEATRQLAGTGADTGRVEQTAFNAFVDDLRFWYERRLSILGGMNRFYHAVEAAAEFVEMRRWGRWKLDLVHKNVIEKGLDVALAVDLVLMQDQFDVAILITGELDSLPSIDYLKNQGKQVCVIELLRGHAPEGRVRAASKLKPPADFVVPIYEMELVKMRLANKGEGDGGFHHLRDE